MLLVPAVGSGAVQVRVVVIEMLRPDRTWGHVGSVSNIEPLGSFSSHLPTGRQVYLFGWHHAQVGLWRSVGGVDIANQAAREVFAADLELLSDLDEPYELDVVLTREPHARIRFRRSEADLAATDGQ